ncbi:hypothetical protein TNCV_2813521 [Trichonephila clavipes]|nr:hypothetical protein TNCV_2813521 [Trichonephila clavipes]
MKGSRSNVVAMVKNLFGVVFVESAVTVTAKYMQFWYRRFGSGVFDVKDAPRKVRPVVEKVNKTTEIIKFDLHASVRSIDQELKIIDH